MIGMNGKSYFEVGKVYNCCGIRSKAKVTRVNRTTGKITVVLCDAHGEPLTGKKHVGTLGWNPYSEIESARFVGRNFDISAGNEVA